MAIKGLSWRVTDKPSWVNITPSNGVGDTNNISITVENSDVPNDEKEYDIKIECIDCESSEPQSIRVCRCVCSCDEITVTQNEDAKTIGEEGWTAPKLLATYEYKSGSICDKNGISATLTDSNGKSYSVVCVNGEIRLNEAIPHTQSLEVITYTLEVFLLEKSICDYGSYTSMQNSLKCNCENNFKNIELQCDFAGTELSQKGYSANTTVFTFNSKQYCPKSGFTATIDGIKINIDVDENTLIGTGKLSAALPKNDNDIKHITLIIKYGNDLCFNKKYTQLGCDCDNNLQDFVTVGKFAEIDPIEHIYLLPQSGLTAGSPVFTTTLNNDCPLNKIKVYLKSSNGSINIPVTVDNSGNGTLTSALAPNRGGRVNLELHVEYGNDDKCYEPLLYVQDGCSCKNIMDIASATFINISTFGGRVNSEIGIYTKNESAVCDDAELKGTLTIKTDSSKVYNFNCINGKIILLSEIPENTGKTEIKFDAKITYGSEQCGEIKEVIQSGVDCNCEDANVGVDEEISFNENVLPSIPKTGLPIDTVIGEYKCNNPQPGIICSDVKFEEINGNFTLEPRATDNPRIFDIVLTSEIEDNDTIQKKNYTIKIYYKVNDVWRECETYPLQQDKLECSCNSIKIKTYHDVGDYPSFPATGTEDWVAFASGDTGLYYADGDLAGVCGKICGYADDSTLVKSTKPSCMPTIEENCVETIVLDPENGDNAHLFEFYVKVADVSEEMEPGTVRTIGADIVSNWLGEVCSPAYFGLEVVKESCDCTGLNKVMRENRKIECEGNFTRITYGVNTINENAYIFAAVKEDENNHLFTTGPHGFRIFYENTGINAKIPNFGCGAESNLTGEDRIAGYIQISGVCNPDFRVEGDYSYENYVEGSGKLCGIYEFPVIQLGCKCDCSYISKKLINNELTFEFQDLYTSDSKEISNHDFPSLFNCFTFKINGDSGTAGNPYIGSWFKAEVISIEETYQTGNLYRYYLNVEITDGQHDNREELLEVFVVDENGVTCEKTVVANVTDSICNCDAISQMPNEATIYIENDAESGHYDFNNYIRKLNCIGLFIIDKDGTEIMTGLHNPYEYKDGNQTAFYIFGGYDGYNYNLYATLASGYEFDPSKEYKFNITWKYKNDSGNYVNCNIRTEVKIVKVNGCQDCNGVLYSKLNLNYNTFNGYTGNFIDKLDYGSYNGNCGQIAVYIMEGYDESTNMFSHEYAPSDSLPYELQYITGGRNLTGGTLYLNVDPLEEDGTRYTDVRIYYANENGVPLEVDGELCYQDIRLIEKFERKCNAISCSVYTPNFKVNNTGDMAAHFDERGTLIIPSEGTGGNWLIATYNNIPFEYAECFKATPSTSEDRIPGLTITTGITGMNIGVYINCPSVGETITFFVDFNVIKKGINDATWNGCSHSVIPVQAGPIS